MKHTDEHGRHTPARSKTALKMRNVIRGRKNAQHISEAKKVRPHVVSKEGTISVDAKGRRLPERKQQKVMTHAVEFTKHGKHHRTTYSKYRNEAKSWRDSIVKTGWAASGKPGPTE